MSDRPVQVVVVAYHAPAGLERCLAALGGELPVTVVDNSSATTVAAVAERHGAYYIDRGRNIGYAAAVNAALTRVADTDVDVLLLNPDAVVSAGDVRQLASFLRLPGNHDVCALAPRLRSADAGEQRLRWPFPSPTRMWAEALGLGRVGTRRTFVVGAVLLLRHEAIRDVGGFDDRFFLYAEEADWQRRALLRGWRSAVCSTVVAEHVGAGTSTDSRRREALFHAGQETYIRKWYGTTGWWLYRGAACSGAVVRVILLGGDRRVAASRRLRLYLQGPRRAAAL